MIGRFVIGMGALALLSACAPSAMLLVGTARPPISAAEVKVYDQPPASFEEVAILIILGDFSDAQTSSLGTGLGSDTYTHNSTISLGVGGAIGIYKKTGKGRAIYVPPG